MSKSILYSIPFVNELLSSPRIKPFLDRLQPGAVYSTIRGVVDDISVEVRSAATEWRAPDLAELIEKIVARLQDVVAEKSTFFLDGRGVVFASGPELLGQSTVTEMVWAIDLGVPIPESAIVSLLCRLTGADDAMVFANPSAAKLAILKTFGRDKSVVVARRDLYDNGSVRLEDLFDFARVRFREIGAVNRTDFIDYERVCSADTGLVYMATGRHSDLKPSLDIADMKRLRELLDRLEIPCVCEVDFAPLIDLSLLFGDEIPTAGEVLKRGYDLIVFSGSQLIGGPGCGLVVGRKEWLERLRRDRFNEAFPIHRVDLAGCRQTLSLLQDRDTALANIPILQRLTASFANLQNRASRLAVQLRPCSFVESVSTVSGFTSLYPNGAGGRLQSCLLAITPKGKTPREVVRMLETAQPRLYAIADSDQVTIDLRMIPPACDSLLVEVFESCSEGGGSAMNRSQNLLSADSNITTSNED